MSITLCNVSLVWSSFEVYPLGVLALEDLSMCSTTFVHVRTASSCTPLTGLILKKATSITSIVTEQHLHLSKDLQLKVIAIIRIDSWFQWADNMRFTLLAKSVCTSAGQVCWTQMSVSSGHCKFLRGQGWHWPMRCLFPNSSLNFEFSVRSVELQSNSKNPEETFVFILHMFGSMLNLQSTVMPGWGRIEFLCQSSLKS